MKPAKNFTRISSRSDAKARAEQNGKFQINTQQWSKKKINKPFRIPATDFLRAVIMND